MKLAETDINVDSGKSEKRFSDDIFINDWIASREGTSIKLIKSWGNIQKIEVIVPGYESKTYTKNDAENGFTMHGKHAYFETAKLEEDFPKPPEEEKPENVRMYSELLVEYLKLNEGCNLKVHNNGQTIGYGFDFKKFPKIKINWLDKNKTTISQAEAERLLGILLDKFADDINDFLDENNLQVDQNTFDALTDLFYNRARNSLTEEVAFAMTQKNDKKVLELLEDFDYRYALKYIYSGDSKKAKAYVDRNPGLKTRREWEYSVYKNGINN